MISVTFDNLEGVKRFYDPIIVEKAARSTVKKLRDKAATRASSEVRKVYAVKARDVKAALTPRLKEENGLPVGLLIYTGGRLSLRYFTAYKGGVPQGSMRPKVKTRAGLRYGARVRVKKTSPSKIIKRAFWGRGRAGSIDGAGEWQIFQRIGLGRLPIRKLTGPSIAHMLRSRSAVDGINNMMAADANKTLEHELDHFIQRQIGTR